MNPFDYSINDVLRLVSAGIMTKDEARRALKLPVVTEVEKLIVSIDARIADFERSIKEGFKPALHNAIAEVLDSTAWEIIDGFGDLADIRVDRA